MFCCMLIDSYPVFVQSYADVPLCKIVSQGTRIMVGEGIRVAWMGLQKGAYVCNRCDGNCGEKFVQSGVCPIGVVR